MKKRIFAMFLSLILLIGLLPTVAMAAKTLTDGTDKTVLPGGVSFTGTDTVYDGTNYYTTMAAALNNVHSTEARTLYCKPGADLGTMTHGHVCYDLTVYGNGAYISGGERDFELDMYATGHSDGTYLSKNVTLTVYALDGAAVWGARHSEHTLNIVLENCQNMQRVYISNVDGLEGTGPNNITLKNCSFDGSDSATLKSGPCTVYSNAPGNVTVKNCTFNQVSEPINLNNKAGAGNTQTIEVQNCSFTDCSTASLTATNDDATWAAPIRFLSSAGGESTLTVDTCTFTYTEGNASANGDVLLGDGRENKTSYPVSANIVNTNAAVQIQYPGDRTANENNAKRVDVSAASSATLSNAVAQIREKKYTSIVTAVSEAETTDTITLLANAELDLGDSNSGMAAKLKGKTIIGQTGEETITFKGVGVYNVLTNMTLKDLHVVDKTAYTYEDGENAWEFTYLEMKGGTYENVVFEDGIMVSGDATFTNCTFNGHNNSSSDAGNVTMYGAWVTDCNITFANCTFTGTRGLKAHKNYGDANLTVIVKDCTFDKLSEKPGVVFGELTEDSSVTIQNCIFDNCQPGDQGQYSFESDQYNKENPENVDELVPFTFTRTGNIFKGASFGDGQNLTEGTYDQDVSTKVAAGYVAVKNDDETWTVLKNVPVTGVALDKETASLYEGDTLILTATVTPDDATVKTVTWTSSDPAVATVDESGKITALKTGTTTITATVGGVTASCTVTVEKYVYIPSYPSTPSYPSYPSTPSYPSYPTIHFTDVFKNDYYYDAVYWAVENDVTYGTGGTNFSPLMDCTRAQAVTFLWRSAGSPEPKTTVNPFTDVEKSDYFYTAVLWAVENDITLGTSATTFSPNLTCTRAQVVTFLYRLAGSPVVYGSNGFSDVADDAYYADAVQWAVANGVTNGTGTNPATFSPDLNCNRSQIVTFLYRFFVK